MPSQSLTCSHFFSLRQYGGDDDDDDDYLLQTSTVGSETLVKGDRVAFWIFPVGDGRWDDPGLLLFYCSRSGWRVKDWGRRRGRATWDSLVLEFCRVHGVDLLFDHSNDTLASARVESRALLTGCVFDERMFSAAHVDRLWLAGLNSAVDDLFQREPCCFCCLLHVLVRGLAEHGVFCNVFWDHVRVFGVDDTALCVAQLDQGVVLDAARGVDGQGHCIARGGRGLFANTQRKLGHEDFGESAAVAKVLRGGGGHA